MRYENKANNRRKYTPKLKSDDYYSRREKELLESSQEDLSSAWNRRLDTINL